MKYSPVIMLLLLPAMAFASPGLTIRIVYCGASSTADTAVQGRLYKGSVLLQTVSFSPGSDTRLFSVDTGTYRFEYTSLLHRLISKTIWITEDRQYDLPFCIYEYDAAKATFKGFIHALADGESLVFSFESYGCFHDELQELRISKIKSQHMTILYPEVNRNGVSRKTMKVTKTLAPAKLELLQQLEARMLSTIIDTTVMSTEHFFWKIKLKANTLTLWLNEGISQDVDKVKEMLYRRE